MTYKIKFQGGTNTSTDMMSRLLGHINGTQSDITVESYKLFAADGTTLIAGGTEPQVAPTSTDTLVSGTARFERVSPAPTIIEIHTADGTVILTDDISGDAKLDPGTWVELSTVLVPWGFTISKVTSGVT